LGKLGEEYVGTSVAAKSDISDVQLRKELASKIYTPKITGDD